jgi:Putative phage tail protein/Concanavalin A-like lectin/glucanases superfamily
MSSTGQIIGTVVGGIIGAFIPGSYVMLGASIGGMIGGYLDPPKQKINRPTTDLSVQTATYGAPVGDGYGNYATFGNVFWVKGNKLDLVEGDDGGKGGGDEPTPDKIYGTFAVGFGEGEIAGFGRIWCSGKLVYDPTSSDIGAMLASADVINLASLDGMKSQPAGGNASGGMTFYRGTATQLPDPNIQADMGAAYTPGYRGLHYIVFVNWPMEDYGNTLMGMQIKAEILNSATVAQYARLNYVDELILDLNDLPGAGSPEYGYFNPHVENGLFVVEKNDEADGYTYSARISHEGVLVSSALATGVTGVPVSGTFGYIGRAIAGDVVYDSVGYTGDFTVGGAVFKTKTSDPDNTCHGMAVGANGRIYTLETVAGDFLCKVYNGESLQLIVSGENNAIQGGNSTAAFPCIPGTSTTFCVESDGIHAWVATQSAGNNDFMLCTILAGHFDILHAFNQTTESHLGQYALLAAIYADGGLCCGVNDHGDFFIYSRAQVLGPTAVDLADIIQDRCLRSGLLTAGDLDLSEITQTVRGYRVPDVMSIRSSLEPLQGAFPFDIVPSSYQIAFKPRGASSVATVDIGECGCVAGNEKTGDILTQSREMDSQLPVKVQVTYFDVAREYDKGTGPGAMRLNTDAVNIQNIDMPLVLNANEAAGIEETLLYLYWMERTEFRFVLPPTRRNLEPADVITLAAPGASYELRLTEINDLPDGRMECSARPNNPAIYTPTAQGQEGQSVGQVLTYPGTSLMCLLDIPCVDDTYMNTPGFVVALDGYASGWEGATLYGSQDNGTTWGALDSLVAPGSVLGSIVYPPASGRTDIVDTANTLTVRFFSTANLASLTWVEFYAGGNHFAVGAHGRWEIIGAKTVVENADGTWTLSDLMRGRFGSEHNRASHVAGDFVALLDPARLEFINMSTTALNVSRLYAGVTLRQKLDPATAESFAYSGENLECWSPVYVNGSRHPTDFDWTIGCTRRSRLPVEPFAGVVTPLGETAESYDLEIWDSGSYSTLKRTFSGLPSPTTTYTTAQQLADFTEIMESLSVRWYQNSSVVGRGHPKDATLSHALALDPHVASVVSLLHFNGTNGSTTIADVKGISWTAAGAARISTAQSRFGGSSLLLDGTGDYVTTASASVWNFGSSNFTFDGWIYPTSSADCYFLMRRGAGVTFSPYVIGTSGQKLYYTGSTNGTTWGISLTGTTTISLNAWHHVAVVRNGNTYTIYLDGVAEATGTLSGALMTTSQPIYVGNDYDGSPGLIGHMDDWRTTMLARWTSNFTPPYFQAPDS